MTPVLIFSAVLLVAALGSGLAQRTVLSTSVLFIGVGLVAGSGGLGWLPAQHGDGLVDRLANLALFVVLYADGMRLSIQDLRHAWRLPGRALLLGLPVTLALIAVLGHWLAGLGWPQALLVAAVLTPTDPVFAAAIVSRQDIAQPLRHLLNVESGLNDGLALPLVLGTLAWMGHGSSSVPELVVEVAGGVVLGFAVPWLANVARRRLAVEMSEGYAPLFAVAIGGLVYTLARLSGVNEYLAAFGAGMTLASSCRDLVDRFHPFGESVAELLKLAALLAFGALIPLAIFGEFDAGAWLFTIGVLALARPLAIALALIGSKLDTRERITAGWFGPKGFASVIYAILVLHSGLPDGDHLFYLCALVVTVSIVVHSSSDVVMARWLERGRSR